MSLRILLFILLAKIMGKSIYLIGIGFGPFTSSMGKIIGKSILKCVDFINVRDSFSYELIIKWKFPEKKLSKTCDLAFGLNHYANTVKKTKATDNTFDKTLLLSLLPYYYGYDKTNTKKDSILIKSTIVNNLLISYGR